MASVDGESTAILLGQAEIIPGGDSVTYLESLARKYDMYICWSMVERDTVFVDAYYNTAVLVGPEGYVGKYRKIQSAGTEAMYFTAGNDVPVFDTRYGKVGLSICMDKTVPEQMRCAKIRGACMILNPTAWPIADLRNGEQDPLLALDRAYDMIRCIENNFVILEGMMCSDPSLTEGEGQAGHARIVSPAGVILVEGGFEDALSVAEIDPIALQREYYIQYNAVAAQNPMKELRSDIYMPIYQEHIDRH